MDKQKQVVDICEAMEEVNKGKYSTTDEKIVAFLNQIKDPYNFKVGSVNVKVAFNGDMQLDECFSNFLATF